MIRDFSDAAKEHLIEQVKRVTPEGFLEKAGDFLGDAYLNFRSKYGSLNIEHYVNDVDTYHEKILDCNDTTVGEIEQIFLAVHNVDNSTSAVVTPLGDVFQDQRSKISRLQETLTIPTFRFKPDTIQAIQSGQHNPADYMIHEEDFDQTKYSEFEEYYQGEWTNTGCALTSAAYVLTMLGIDTTPLDAYHRSGDSTSIYWDKAANGEATWSGFQPPSSMNDLAKQSKGDPNKSQLILTVNGGGHFVVLKDITTDANGNITQYTIFDPWKACEKTYTPENIHNLNIKNVSYYQKG